MLGADVGLTVMVLPIAETAFATCYHALADQLLRHKYVLNEESRQLRDHHFTRMRQGEAQSHNVCAVYLNVLTHLRQINSSVIHVAYAIAEHPAEDGRPARPLICQPTPPVLRCPSC